MARYRVLLSVTITLLISVVTAPSTLAFNDTNSVLGIVYVPKADVIVEVFGRSSINDTTNGEGLYCLLVSKGIPSFQLTYTAKGYWSQTSRKTYQNNQQRQKIEGVSLRLKQVSDVSNFGVLRDLLGETFSVWQEAQPATKRLIVSDLIAFREEVARTAGIPAQDRQRGVMAINETLSRMGASVPAAAGGPALLPLELVVAMRAQALLPVVDLPGVTHPLKHVAAITSKADTATGTYAELRLPTRASLATRPTLRAA